MDITWVVSSSENHPDVSSEFVEEGKVLKRVVAGEEMAAIREERYSKQLVDARVEEVKTVKKVRWCAGRSSHDGLRVDTYAITSFPVTSRP